MNNVSLNLLESNRIEFLKKYGLDSESIQTNRGRIKEVSDDEANNLGKELFDLVSNKSFNDDYEKVCELICNGANIEYKDENKGNFALLICARKKYLQTFLVLLKFGANVNQVNNFLTTATMASARHGNKEMLEILIKMGANVNARCLDGENAIMSAKRHDRVECFNLLVEASAYLNNRNLLNQNILDIPSKADFSKYLKDFFTTRQVETSFEDTQNILDEATNKMQIIKEKK